MSEVLCSSARHHVVSNEETSPKHRCRSIVHVGGEGGVRGGRGGGAMRAAEQSERKTLLNKRVNLRLLP